MIITTKEREGGKNHQIMTWVEFWLCHIIILWSWACFLVSLWLHFLYLQDGKKKKIRIPLSLRVDFCLLPPHPSFSIPNGRFYRLSSGKRKSERGSKVLKSNPFLLIWSRWEGMSFTNSHKDLTSYDRNLLMGREEIRVCEYISYHKSFRSSSCQVRLTSENIHFPEDICTDQRYRHVSKNACE